VHSSSSSCSPTIGIRHHGLEDTRRHSDRPQHAAPVALTATPFASTPLTVTALAGSAIAGKAPPLTIACAKASTVPRGERVIERTERIVREVGGSWPVLTKTNYADWSQLMKIKMKARRL